MSNHVHLLIETKEKPLSKIIQGSSLYGHYEKTVDRESAFEKLKARTEERKMEPEEVPSAKRRAIVGQHH
jgi:REP element-mobilizing transposase RayT